MFWEKLKELSANAAKAAIEVLPKETKNELATACLNHYSEKISKLMVDMALQKNIKLQVEGVEIVVS